MTVGRDDMDLPRRLRTPTHLFVLPGVDLFAQPVPFIEDVFSVMASEGRHEFQVPTNRLERAIELPKLRWTPNIWLGGVVSDDAAANDTLDVLRRTPAKVRFAHLRVASGRVPEIDPSGLDFVLVEANGEPAGTDVLERCCNSANVRLFLGPRPETADLRGSTGADALVTRNRSDVGRR
jgi:protein gp37